MRNTSKTTRMLCEGAIAIALAIALSYLKLDLWFQGGSIDAVMIPLLLFALRWGAGWGVLAGLACGTLKYFLGAGWAIDWVSILFDYSVAYAVVGLAGVVRNRVKLVPVGVLTGCVARFLVHYASGVTVYARYMPEEFMGLPMTSPLIYSALYNGGYMLPNTVLTLVVCLLLAKPLGKWIGGEDLKTGRK